MRMSKMNDFVPMRDESVTVLTLARVVLAVFLFQAITMISGEGYDTLFVFT